MITTYFNRHTHGAGTAFNTSGVPSVNQARLLPGMKIDSISVTYRAVPNPAMSSLEIPKDMLYAEVVFWTPGEKADVLNIDPLTTASVIDRGVFFRLDSNETVQKRFYNLYWSNSFSLRFRTTCTTLYGLPANDVQCDFWVEIEYSRDQKYR